MAGNEQVFDSIVDPIANKQVQDLTADLAALDKQAVDTAKSVNQLNNITANSRTYQQLTQNTNATTAATERLQQIQNRTAVTANQLAQSNLRLQQQQDRTAASTARQTLAAQRANGEYAKLVASYNAATLAARNAGVQFGTTSTQFTTAAAEANVLRRQLDSIDQPLGNYTRNVGNYFNRFYGGIRTIANILPGLGIQGIFLAIFEGLKYVVDQTGLFQEKISKLGKVTQALNDVFKESNKSIAEQTTQLKYLYISATDVNNSMDERLKSAKKLQEEYPKTFGLQSQENIINGQAIGIYNSLTEEIIKNAKAKAAANKIAEESSKVLDAEVQILKIRGANRLENEQTRKDLEARVRDALSYEFKRRGIIQSGAQFEQSVQKELQRQYKLSDDRAKKSIDTQQNLIKNANNNIKGIESLLGGATQIGNGINNGVGDKIDKPKTPKSEKSLYDEQLKAIKLRETAILENEKSGYDERLKAVNDYYNDAYDLTTKYSRKGVLSQQQANNKITEFDIETNKERIKIREDAEKELSKLIKDGLKGQEDAERASIEVIQKGGDDRVLAIETNAADAERALAEQYAAGIITQKQYQSQLTAIEDESTIDRLDQEIITTQTIIDLRKGLLFFGIGSAKELQSAEDKLAAQKLARVKAGTKAVLDGIKDETQAREQLHQAEQRLGEESLQLIQTVVDAGYQRQLEALQNLSEQVDENASKEKDANNSTLQSAKDKADKNAVIDARTAAQKEQISGRERQLKREQAQFDRAVAIARIIEQTAIAVVSALSIPIAGLALAAVVGALGAVQLATVLATPLPAFEKGGVTPGGRIIWGEAGVELATEPSGKQYLSPASATVANMPKGTVITPHLELMGMLRPDKVNYAGGQEVPWREVLNELRLNRPNKKQPVTKIYVDNSYADIRKRYFK